QGFSKAAHAHAVRGGRDAKRGLTAWTARVVEALDPPTWSVENVPPSPGIDLMRERIEWLTETLAGPLEPVAPDSADDGEPVRV
ncbi:MAG: hypothetical protein P8N02_17225, partial [Actinomycetota bacterium]|nr:hypothetical protein [Actinomycetota bacterium]